MNSPINGKRLTSPMPLTIQRPDHVADLWRLKTLFAVVVVMFCIIVARLWYLQIAMGASFAEDAEKQRTRPVRRLAARGMILDTKGRVLATSRSQYVVSLLPQEISKNPQALPILASILNVSVSSLQDQLDDPDAANNQKRNKGKSVQQAAKDKLRKIKIKSTEPIKVAEKVDLRVVTQIEEQKLDLFGVEVSKEPIRYYLDNRLCAHVLGMTHPISKDQLRNINDDRYHENDIIGTEGLERTYEKMLRGNDGVLLLSVDAKNRMLRRLDETPPSPGNTLTLSLDLDLQRAAYLALQDTLANGHPGSAVALDPNTGAVLAMVSTPAYELNDYGRKYDELKSNPLRPMLNRATGSRYPCGSTFKLVTAAAGLETGALTPYSNDRCSGSLRLGNRTFKCDGVHGRIDFETAIAKSCDVFFYDAGLNIGHVKLADWARRFGLGEKTGIDLPGETRGIVPTPEYKSKKHLGPWVQGDLVNMSIGQGYVGVSPIQLADYTAAIANGGTLWRPQLVREIRNPSGAIISSLTPEKRGDLGVHPANLAAIVRGMRKVVLQGGTAAGIVIPGVDIAAKTGTAQTGTGKDNSVFVCFAPVEHPKIAIAVLIEKVGHGSDFAAPVAQKMLAQFFSQTQQARR